MTLDITVSPATPDTDDGAILVGGERYFRDAKGNLVPEGLVKPADKLIDQTVRKIMAFAEDISAQVGRFKCHCFEDISTTGDLLAEQYGARLGGRKGNMTLMTLDGLMKVQMAVADQLTFGPELQIAKELVDACIGQWAEGADDKVRALVNHAFDVDKEGKINRAALFALRRLEIDDDAWTQAMAAIGDAIRIVGSKQYVRFYRRENEGAAWIPVTVDIAAA